MNQEKTVYLDGNTVTPEDIYEIGYNPHTKVDITKEAWHAIKEGRQFIEDLIKSDQVVYGINTGFGNFANVQIEKQDLEKLQRNLIRSHACGVGDPLSPNRTRMLLGLRLNVLAKGHSGIRPETVQTMLDAINSWCLPYVPCQGTVGASGDLAPLSHLALGMMGEGKMWDPEAKEYKAAKDVLKSHQIRPVCLGAKEGLALINGTQMITCFGCEAIVRARNIARQADVIGALTLEALKGTVKAFHPLIHAVRPHKGQGLTASRLRALLHREGNESEISISHKNCGKVQDSYTLRCMPQVHGVTHDTLKFVYDLLKTECNSATDNPMIFADPVNDAQKYGADPEYKMEEKSFIISGGNFHGEYPAKALDFLAIAIHELSSISERRIERLVNPNLSELPAFLVKNGGLNSGFMIAHCTAASLVSENKVLCHPASVDSIPTSAAKEDHVSMGGFAARKALKVVEHVEYVLGIELLASCQAIDLLRPLKTTPILEEVYALVRQVAEEWKEDRFMQPDIEACHKLLLEQQVWNAVAGKIDKKLHRLL